MDKAKGVTSLEHLDIMPRGKSELCQQLGLRLSMGWLQSVATLWSSTAFR